jgi:hypothetical protein
LRASASPRAAAEIGMAIGAVLDKHKMAKRFDLIIADAHFAFVHKMAKIANKTT